MALLLSQQPEEISPLVMIIFVVAVIVVSFAIVRAQSKSAVKDIKKKYSGRIVEECSLNGNYNYSFVTENELVVQNNQHSFMVFNLNSIKYVHSFRDIATRSWAFTVSDENQKSLKGELTGSTNAGRQLKHGTLFFMSQQDADKLCDFVIKHAPHVEKADR